MTWKFTDLCKKQYMRLDHAATHLLPSLKRGRTPLQLQIALSNRFKITLYESLLRFVFKSARLEIEQLAALYMAQNFSQHPPKRLQVRRGIRAWSRLRWRLWVATVMSRIISAEDK